MNVITDTKRLKARLNDIQAHLLFERVIKPYKQRSNPYYYYSIEDKRNGVYLGHVPRAPYVNYTTSLSFHGYSNDSPLLKAIFAIVPLEQWLVSEIHVAFDYSLPYEQFHAVRPAKRADVKLFPTSMYVGGQSSATRLYIYDKQVQMMDKRNVHTDTWTRVELRFKFSPMKRVSAITVDDFMAAEQYRLFTDIGALPEDLQRLTIELNKDRIKWKEVDWRTKAKVREHATDQGDNLYQHMLSNIGNIKQFIYSPLIVPSVMSL